MLVKIFAIIMLVLGIAVAAGANSDTGKFIPEAIGTIETLPEEYPDHWVMVHDFSFFHMLEGKVLVVDPLAADVGGQYKGMMTASFTAAYTRSAKRREHYVVETFFSRGGRGGKRTDVVTIWDPASLKVISEIEIPAKRLTGMPKATMLGLIGDDRFLGVYNFTPGQSISIIDLEKREFVAEVPTPGCGFILPNGKHSFTSICSNGSMLTSHLDTTGQLKDARKTEILFDPQDDPIFEAAAITDSVAYFPTFKGNVLPLDISGEDVKAGEFWSLTSTDEKNWRPGGIRPAITDAQGVGYFLMHPHGAEGTHKDGGSEVWLYDLAEGKRINRVELANWGMTLGTSGTGDGRLLFVTNDALGVDVYRLPDVEFVHTLAVGAGTPFMMHSAQ